MRLILHRVSVLPVAGIAVLVYERARAKGDENTSGAPILAAGQDCPPHRVFSRVPQDLRKLG